jgi:hypothetical protein
MNAIGAGRHRDIGPIIDQQFGTAAACGIDRAFYKFSQQSCRQLLFAYLNE